MLGDVDTACRMATAARDAGAWGFKVQLLDPVKIATADAPIYWRDVRSDVTTQRDSFERAGSVDYARWVDVKKHCDDIGIEFLATPFDLEAVDVLADIDCEWVKVASGDITFTPLLDRIRTTRMHVMLSTGASSTLDVATALDHLDGCRVVLLACSLAYPTPQEHAQLGRIETLRRMFPNREIGYSDHTIGARAAFGAALLGATWIEKHFTTTPGDESVPDNMMAASPAVLAEYVREAARGAEMRGDGLMGATPVEHAARLGARRKAVTSRSLQAGRRLLVDDVEFKRTGTVGLDPAAALRLVGRTLTRDLPAGALLLGTDVHVDAVG